MIELRYDIANQPLTTVLRITFLSYDDRRVFVCIMDASFHAVALVLQ